VPKLNPPRSMPAAILKAAHLLNDSGIPDYEAGRALGANRVTFQKILSDDGSCLYHAATIKAAQSGLEASNPHKLIAAWNALSKARKNYLGVLQAL